MRRRAFLQSLFALGAGFSALGAGFFEIARACSPHVETALVPIPTLVGDGVHDDTAALQAWLDGKPVRDVNGAPVPQALQGGVYLLTRPLTWPPTSEVSIIGADFVAASVAASNEPVFTYTL